MKARAGAGVGAQGWGATQRGSSDAVAERGGDGCVEGVNFRCGVEEDCDRGWALCDLVDPTLMQR